MFEKDMEKAHVINNFIRKGFEEGEFEMMTRWYRRTQFLYAEDAVRHWRYMLPLTLNQRILFTLPHSILHLLSLLLKLIQCFNRLGSYWHVRIKPGLAKDSVVT